LLLLPPSPESAEGEDEGEAPPVPEPGEGVADGEGAAGAATIPLFVITTVVAFW